MEIRDWITFGTVLVAILGWFTNGHLNRRHEIFKRRMDLRFEMYESCIRAAEILEKIFQSKDQSQEALNPLLEEFIVRLETCQVRVLMYGTQQEIDNIFRIAEFADRNKHVDMRNAMAELMRSTRDNLRKDLKMQKIISKE